MEEVGGSAGANVATSGVEFALETGDDGAPVVQGVTGAQQIVPRACPVEAQAQTLSG